MAFTVDDVFTAARDSDTRFTDQQTPPKPLLRFLDRQRDNLIQETVALYPDAVLTCTEEIDLPLDDFEDGVVLPTRYFARAAWAFLSDGVRKQRFRLVAWNNLSTVPAVRFPCGAIRVDRLYLAGSPGLWHEFSRVTIDYVPVPHPLEAIDDDFAPLPDSARNALVDAAALWMAKRDPEIDESSFADDYADSKARYLQTLTSQRRAAPVLISEGA